MKKLAICLMIVLVFGLCGCSSMKLGDESNLVVNQVEDRTLTVKSFSSTDYKLVVQVENKTEIDIQTGAAYDLEYKQNGKWYSIKTDEVITTAEAYSCGSEDIVEFEMNLKNVYKHLRAGHYRIVKYFIEEGSNLEDGFYLADEFEIK